MQLVRHQGDVKTCECSIFPLFPGLDSAAGAFRRVHQNEEEVTIVKQMPRLAERALQPTIAVITAQYFEKIAVDAMMTNKQTFMRYATVGKFWTNFA